MNIDICFVPAEHHLETKLPAVSGSSGHLVVERVEDAKSELRTWPGKVFDDPILTYAEAMQRYAAETRDRLVSRSPRREIQIQAPNVGRIRRAIQVACHEVRQQRKREDLAWREAKEAWRVTRENRHRLSEIAFAEAESAWIQRRTERRISMVQRQEENRAWRESIVQAEAIGGPKAVPPTWIAVLVITDNCTRQCLSLPAFTSGARLSGEEVVKALRALLPSELAFLISDQGGHFRSNALKQLAQDTEFVHVPVYRHRPESSGVAERFVRTPKEWLRPAFWQTYEALVALLEAFREEYNDRPHQGLSIPGLSPNEFAHRIWLM